MKKRGISPLIATVLIIGFTIVLAAAIMQWGSSLIEKIKGESEEKALTKITCATQVNFDIKDACDTLANSIIVTIDNKGNIGINSIISRLTGRKTVTQKIEEKIDSFGVRKISIPYAQSFDLGSINKVDIFPKIIIDGKEQTCEPKSKEVIPCEGVALPDVNKIEDWFQWPGNNQDNLKSVEDLTKDAPESVKTGLNTQGYGLTGTTTLYMYSKAFTIPPGFTGIKIGSWAGTGGEHQYMLVKNVDEESLKQDDINMVKLEVIDSIKGSYPQSVIPHYGAFILKGTGENLRLVAVGTSMITVSEIYLYQAPETTI